MPTTGENYTGNELLPPENHPRVGYRVFEILAEILQDKNDLGLPAKWMRAYELSKNRHWRNTSKKAPLVTANMLHSHRVRTVNTLTDNNPTFNVIQVGEVEGDPEKEDIFDTLLKTAEFWWTDTEQQSVLEETVLNGELYGATFEKVIFDRTLEGGLGEVETLTVDPWHIGWYPVKCKKIEKAHAVLHFYPMSVREARWRWPDMAEDIVSDSEYIKMLGDQRLEIKANSLGSTDQGYFTQIGNAIKQILSTFGTGGGKGSGDLKEETLICECWVKDYTREKLQAPAPEPAAEGQESPEAAPEVEPEPKVQAADKYPGNIRCVIVCNGGKVVLEDKPNPSINPEINVEQAAQTYLWGRFPFSKAQSHTDTGNPWGMSDFEQLEMLNIEINKTISQLTLVKDRVARVKLINPKDSGVSNNEFTNAPGIVNPSSAMAAQGIRYLDPPSINPELFKVLDIYRDLFFVVAGSFELESAQTPGREVIAYKAIAALLERAATMLRGKIRNYTKLIRERGRMYLSHVMNWYTEERFISYEQDGKKMSRAIRGTDMLLPAKLSVVSGSTMPVSRVQEREEALGLFEKGAIDAEELLKKLDWKDYKDVIARVKSGPVGEFISKLGMMGFPPSMLQAFQEISALEMNDFEKLMKQGEIPPIQQLLTPPPAEGEPQATPIEQADIQLAAAKAESEKANAELIREKTRTEQVIQATKLAGMKFDKEKLLQDRARVVSDIRNTQHQQRLSAHEAGRAASKEDFDKGMQLRDKDQAEKSSKFEQKVKAKEAGVKPPKDEPAKKIAPPVAPAAQDANQNPQGPYVEKGMGSNNEERK